MVGGARRKSQARSKRRGRHEEDVDEDNEEVIMTPIVSQNANVSQTPSTKRLHTPQPQIIRTLDDWDICTSPYSHGNSLVRRVVENENVDTPGEMHPESTQISGRNLNSSLQTPELVDKDVSGSHGGADVGNSTSQLESKNVDAPGEMHTESTQVSGRNLSSILQTPELVHKDVSDSRGRADVEKTTSQLAEAPNLVDAPLCLNSVPHEPKTTSKDVSMDDIFDCALVAVVTDHTDGQLLENNCRSLWDDLSESSPTQTDASQSQGADTEVGDNDSEDSHHSLPFIPTDPREEIPTVPREEIGSSGANNGSKKTVVNGNKLLQSPSLNTTNIVEEMDDGDFFEADSVGFGNGLVSVQGYKVKVHNVGLLTSILAKHGDIGANCSMKSVTFRSFCVELVCDIVQNLMKTNLKVILDKDLQSMMASVNDLEKEQVDVGWLRARLEEIYEAKSSIPKLRPSSDVRQLQIEQLCDVQNIRKQLEEYKRALLDLQKKIDSTETTLSVAETKVSDTATSISKNKAILKHVYGLETLADGLL